MAEWHPALKARRYAPVVPTYSETVLGIETDTSNVNLNLCRNLNRHLNLNRHFDCNLKLNRHPDRNLNLNRHLDRNLNPNLNLDRPS